MSAAVDRHHFHTAPAREPYAAWQDFPALALPVESAPAREWVGLTRPIDPALWTALENFAPTPAQRFRTLCAAMEALLLRYAGILAPYAAPIRFTDLLEQVPGANLLQPTIHAASGLRAALATAPSFEQSSPSEADLTLIYLDSGAQCLWRHAESQWAPGRLELLHEHFWNLLAAMLAEPNAPIGQHDYLTEGERTTLLETWAGQADFPRGLPSLPAAFEDIVRKYPDEVALVAGKTQVTYASLNESANRLAHYLMYFSVRPSSVVAIWLDPGVDFVTSFLAVMKLGAVVAFLDPQADEAATRAALDRLGNPLLITLGARAELAKRAGWPLLDLDHEKIAIRSQSKLNPGVQVFAEHPAAVLYCPSAAHDAQSILLLHRSLVHLARHNTVFPAGLQHTLALTSAPGSPQSFLELLCALLHGARLILPVSRHAFGPRDYCRLVREFAPSVLLLSAAQIAHWEKGLHEVFRTVPVLAITDGPLYGRIRENLLAERGALTTVELYGPAEVCLFGAFQKLRPDWLPDGAAQRSYNLGKPTPGTARFLLDSQGLPVPVGVPGEVCYETPLAAWGYLDNSEATQHTFTAKPFAPEQGGLLVRSHQVGVRTQTGEILDWGSASLLAKLEGQTLHLHAIESSLRQHDAVRDCAVVVRQVAGHLKRLVAYVVLEKPVTNPRHVLRTYLAECLPDPLIPNDVITLDQLPLNAYGQTDRASLSLPALGPEVSGAEADARAAEANSGLLRRPSASPSPDPQSLAHQLRRLWSKLSGSKLTRS